MTLVNAALGSAIKNAGGNTTAGCGICFREDFAPASEASVRLAHQPEYVEFLKNLDNAIRGAAAGHTSASAAGAGGVSAEVRAWFLKKHALQMIH